ncbi:glycoside hydrolase family 3 N-terminal domain-containing protein [Limibacter armeniacum]|uniref:glycoside hydrolase family 3 N-terminal domain-containing protein n=1 Tax=Limibacter armeniacum TaxID=466084 RepID=UPI002FE56BFE
MKTKNLLLLFCILPVLYSCSKSWEDESLPSIERAQLLISEMTLEEKVRQMNMTRGEYLMVDAKPDEDKMKMYLGELGIGSIHDLFTDNAEDYNRIQKATIESSRHGIPALVMEEMLHGFSYKGSTVFPMPIGLGAMWNPELMEKVGKVIGTEARIHGAHVSLGPTLGIGREPRWGRVAETYGEDTHLNAEMAVSMLKGMGGLDPTSKFSMLGGPKHFAVHSAPLTGSNASPVLLGERTSRTDFLPVFERAIKEAGAVNVMSSYSELDGVPCTGNEWLLTDVLRNEWGFDGFTVSDLGAMRFLWNVHHFAESPKEAIRKATIAGMDMQFYDFTDSVYQATLIELVEEGKLDVKYIDRAVTGILNTKFKLGLFEDPYIEQKNLDDYFHNKGHQDIAYEAGVESIVLLENNGILPLDKKKYKEIAVLGALVETLEMGGYSPKESAGKGISILDGLKKAAPEIDFTFTQGANIVERGGVVPAKYIFHDNGQKGFKAKFYNNTDLEGEPAFTAIHNEVDFEWPWNPYPGVEDDYFSASWEGYIEVDHDMEGWVGTSSDDGSRLFIDGELVLNAWKGSTYIAKTPFTFKKGQKYKIRYEFFDYGWHASASLRWSETENDILNAVRLAKSADLSIIVVGENERTVSENRDVSSLDLSGNQLELIKQVASLGKPYVVVLQNGRPLSTNWVSANADALLEAWFAGEKGGKAIADVLFGNQNPSGKLPISVAKSVGQLPIYYNQKPTTIHRYVDVDDKPLYPFGYGLSYSTFAYNNLKIAVEEDQDDFEVKVAVEVTNTSEVDGKEVVQLYTSDLFSSVTVARIALKKFEKVLIKAGETKTIEFVLTKEDLKLWNLDKKWVVESGEFTAMVGTNSTDLIKENFKLNKDYSI